MKKSVKILSLLCLALLLCTMFLTACDLFGHTHSYGDWEVVREPTAMEEGKKVRYCSCGEKQTEAIAKIKQESTTLTWQEFKEELQAVYDKSTT